MVARLGEIAFERGQTQVNLTYNPTAKNQPALNFLNAVAIDFSHEVEPILRFQLPVEYAKSITYNPQANYLASAAPKTKSTPASPATASKGLRTSGFNLSSDRTYSNIRIQVEAANKQALRAYLLQAYPLQVTLFRAINQPVGAIWYSDAQLGWKKLAIQGVEVHHVPGNHLSLMAEPDVQVLAAKFRLCLGRSLSS